MTALDAPGAVRLGAGGRPLKLYEDLLATESDSTFSGKATDFSARYLALSQVHEHLKDSPDEIDLTVVAAIGDLLLKQAYDHQRQGFFLYREAAETLGFCIEHAGLKSIARAALRALTRALAATSGDAHRAAAGALGALSLPVQGPELRMPSIRKIPSIQHDRILIQAGVGSSTIPDIVGRSLVIRPARINKMLVLKLARPGDFPETLQRECCWMEFLGARFRRLGRRFDIPAPLTFEGNFVFRLRGVPPEYLPEGKLHPEIFAIGFWADRAYFDYPNESCPKKHLGNRSFQEVMLRNAWILGRLASSGIVHDALIPLFHNRTQRGRRDDQGVYEWIRAGRLDRWLHSCAYPNIGVSGIRDFEHFFAFDSKRGHLYRSLGKQLFSLLLLTGSHFRNRDIRRMGVDADGRPVDARGLFDKEVIKKVVSGIFRNYYKGFTGDHFKGNLPFELDGLSDRMTEEMGVDRHMEELIRVADQQEMTDHDFRAFLTDRGVEAGKIKRIQKGVEDIVIHSGPHLGAFNATISLPELIETVASMAALCISGKFWSDRYGYARVKQNPL